MATFSEKDCSQNSSANKFLEGRSELTLTELKETIFLAAEPKTVCKRLIKDELIQRYKNYLSSKRSYRCSRFDFFNLISFTN